MKQSILKKLLLSGSAALGVIGLSSPAAFAWSGSSGYSNYNNYNNQHNYYYKTSSYSYGNNNSKCYMMKDWNDWGNQYGDRDNDCNYMYSSYQYSHNNCDHNYGKSYQSYGSYQTAYW